MSESDMRQKLVKNLRKLGQDPIPVENSARPGTPDVNYVLGWAELKWLRNWPKKEETDVKIEHYTPHQKLWLRNRWKAGGLAWLIVQCKREWFLFTAVAAQHIGSVPRDSFYKLAWAHWDGIDWQELCDCLLDTTVLEKQTF